MGGSERGKVGVWVGGCLWSWGWYLLVLSEHTDPISGREMPSRNLTHFSLFRRPVSHWHFFSHQRPRLPRSGCYWGSLQVRLQVMLKTLHTPFIFLLMVCSFLLVPHHLLSLSLSFLYYHYFSLWWNHEGTTSKRAMLWKVADEIKESHDKQPCTSPPCLVSLCSYLLPPLFSSLSGTDRVYLIR